MSSNNKAAITHTLAQQPAEKILAEKGQSLWHHAWLRLKQNRLAIASAVILFLVVTLVIVGPMLSPHQFDTIYWDEMSIPPDFASGHYFGTDAMGRDLLVS